MLHLNIEWKAATWMSVALFFVVQLVLPSYLNGLSLTLYPEISELFVNPRMDTIVTDRTALSVFNFRLGILDVQEWLAYYGVPTQLTFTILNLAFLACIPFLLDRINRLVLPETPRRDTYVLIIIQYPVLFFFVTRNSAYEDSLQIVLLLLAWLFFLRKQTALLFVAAISSVMVRETSIFFLGYILLLALKERRYLTLTYIVSAVPIAFILLFFVSDSTGVLDYTDSRLITHLNINYANTSRTINTLMSAITSIIPFVIVERVFCRFNKPVPIWEVLLRYFILGLSTLIILTNSIATETRLYLIGALPFFPYFFDRNVAIAFSRGFQRVNWIRLSLFLVISGSIWYVAFFPLAYRSFFGHFVFLTIYTALLTEMTIVLLQKRTGVK